MNTIRYENATCETLADKVLAGASLRIFLKPDALIENRDGTETYTECLDLPFVQVRDGLVWASQSADVVKYDEELKAITYGYYSYCNEIDIFCNTTMLSAADALRSGKVTTGIMSNARYEVIRWVSRDDFGLIFDSANEAARPAEIHATRDAIAEGCLFKLAVLNEGVWSLAPVVYPFHYPKADVLDFQTRVQFFPDLFRTKPDATRALLKANAPELLDRDNPKGRELHLNGVDRAFSSYYRVTTDGRCQRLYDIPSGKTVAFDRFKIFASHS